MGRRCYEQLRPRRYEEVCHLLRPSSKLTFSTFTLYQFRADWIPFSRRLSRSAVYSYPRGSRECMHESDKGFCSYLIGKVGRASELQITLDAFRCLPPDRYVLHPILCSFRVHELEEAVDLHETTV